MYIWFCKTRPNCFPKWLYHFAFSPAISYQNFCCSASSPAFGLLYFWWNHCSSFWNDILVSGLPNSDHPSNWNQNPSLKCPPLFCDFHFLRISQSQTDNFLRLSRLAYSSDSIALSSFSPTPSTNSMHRVLPGQLDTPKLCWLQVTGWTVLWPDSVLLCSLRQLFGQSIYSLLCIPKMKVPPEFWVLLVFIQLSTRKLFFSTMFHENFHKFKRVKS